MTLYKVVIDNRNYNTWNIYHANTFEPVDIPDMSPAENKLFTGDVFIYNKGKVEIIHSSIRTIDNIPAVLILDNNKTYGRQSKEAKSGKLLYKCIPDDGRIPTFLVPYEIKQMGFSKVISNIYITIRFSEWSDKHPHAVINQVIGPVDILDNFYEYQLYCKSLNISFQKFHKDTSKALKNKSSCHDNFAETIFKSHPEIENRTNTNEWKVFSIDPPESLDFDDAFSIKNDNNHTILSIYIANVTIWMDSLNLWDSFSRRISTIYLPDRKRPMLPTILSDCICSLQEKTKRFAFTMDVIIENEEIIDIQYKNCMIQVVKNYAYEEKDLLAYSHYQNIMEVVKKLSKKHKYINNIRNSHDVVCYLMIFMNYHCAKELLKNKEGIFRSTIITKEISLPDTLPSDVNNFIKMWNSSCGQYINGSKIQDTIEHIRHDVLEMDAYIHITSPIRRLVDLLNIIKFQEIKKLIKLSSNSIGFYDKWIGELDYINVTMRAIRKIQNDCNLLDTCFNHPETMEKLYDGYCFDKLLRGDGLYQYMVYLPELRLMSKLTLRENLENFEKRQYKLFLFNDEEKFKKKIRLHLSDI